MQLRAARSVPAYASYGRYPRCIATDQSCHFGDSALDGRRLWRRALSVEIPARKSSCARRGEPLAWPGRELILLPGLRDTALISAISENELPRMRFVAAVAKIVRDGAEETSPTYNLILYLPLDPLDGGDASPA